MSNFRIVALSEDLADKVRATLRSPQYGHPAHVETASGFGPCRSCLGVFREGHEDRVLLTYNTFSGMSMTSLPGPVFIHRDSCRRFTGAGVPDDLETLELLLDAYDDDGRVIIIENPETGRAEESIERLLKDSSVSFINIRNAKAGCFVARVDRVPAESGIVI